MKIVNLNHRPGPPWIYCGRRMGGKQPREASPLGNPFKLKGRNPADVQRVLAQYREWLWSKIRVEDPQMMALLNLITAESTLACYCAEIEGEAIFNEPERCHTQVIWKAWSWLKQQREAA